MKDNITVCEGSLDTTFMKIFEVDEDSTIEITFFPDSQEEVQIEISMQEFYERLISSDGEIIKPEFEEE